MELSPLPLMLLLISNIHSGHTQERPKAAVIKKNDTLGKVSIICEIPGSEDDWTYGWFGKGSNLPFSTDRELIVQDDASHSSGDITCRGERNSDGQTSETSDAVTVILSFQIEAPKAVLTVHPEPSQIFIGDTVTLTCDVQGEGWTYGLMCGNEIHTSEGKEMRITVQFTQTCMCYGCNRQSVCSKFSDTVALNATNRLKVTVNPQSSVFTGDTVTLSCDVGRSTGAKIIWYKDFERIEAVDEATLRAVKVSDGGEYRCAESGTTTQSPGVKLTVRKRPKAMVRVQPDGRVLRGETVTLTCDIQHSDVSSWNYSWSKDDSLIHVSESQEYRISSVNESHTGRYSCTGRETRGSRYSHTSDQLTLTVSGSPDLPVFSVLKLLSFLLAASLYLLVSVILAVKCYRAHAQSDEINQ